MKTYQTPGHFIEEVCSNILFSNQVNEVNFNLLSLILQLDCCLNDENKRLIHRLLYAIRRNLLTFIGIPEEQIGTLQSTLENALSS